MATSLRRTHARGRAAWASAAAGFAAALYAGFRLNECLGTDLVLARESAGVALTFLHVLNSKRTPAVLLLVGVSLASGGFAVILARPRRWAIAGMALLLVEDLLTGIHIRLALLLQGVPAGAPPPDWDWLRGRYVFDDVARTALLAVAAVAFLVATVGSEPKIEPEGWR